MALQSFKGRSKTFVLNNQIPVPAARPRGTKSGYFYDSQKNIKMVIGIELSNQMSDEPLFCGPLEVTLVFHFPLPASYTDKKRKALAGSYMTHKPDLDNIAKMYFDCAAYGVIYKDDASIASTHMYKVYCKEDEEPHTIMRVTELR